MMATKRMALSRGRPWLLGGALLVTAAVVALALYSSLPAPSPSRAGAHAVFRTLPPGASLPSGAQCARWVRASPSPEIRPANKAFNRTIGQRLEPALFPAGDSPRVKKLAPLISGDFTGTTQQILRWAACKWGINQNIVFAQAAAESSWQQGHLGDWGTDRNRCPPGHGLGADGRPGECPESYGILQTKYALWQEAWPGIGASTAMNADVAYAIWRSCYDGYEIWLRNSAPRGQPYHAGELWGCVGRWFAGSWHTPAANQYIRRVQRLLRERAWQRSWFAGAG